MAKRRFQLMKVQIRELANAHDLCWPNIRIRQHVGHAGRRIAPHGTDTKQRIRESFGHADED